MEAPANPYTPKIIVRCLHAPARTSPAILPPSSSNLLTTLSATGSLTSQEMCSFKPNARNCRSSPMSLRAAVSSLRLIRLSVRQATWMSC